MYRNFVHLGNIFYAIYFWKMKRGKTHVNLHEDDIVEWINCNDEASIVSHMMDEEIFSVVMHPTGDKHENSEEPLEIIMDCGIAIV